MYMYCGMLLYGLHAKSTKILIQNTTDTLADIFDHRCMMKTYINENERVPQKTIFRDMLHSGVTVYIRSVIYGNILTTKQHFMN